MYQDLIHQKVVNMIFMFNNCSSLISLDLSSFNTSNVTNMEAMFQNDVNLENITFGDNFNTSKVKDMIAMFASCKKLSYINLSNFDTSNVKEMKKYVLLL